MEAPYLVEKDGDLGHHLDQPQLDGACRIFSLCPRVREEDVELAAADAWRLHLDAVFARAQQAQMAPLPSTAANARSVEKTLT